MMTSSLTYNDLWFVCIQERNVHYLVKKVKNLLLQVLIQKKLLEHEITRNHPSTKKTKIQGRMGNYLQAREAI